jgi:hypothetical protein
MGDVRGLEEGLRKALLLDGARLLSDLISQIKAPDDQPQPGEKCHPRRKLVLLSLLGPLTIYRSYYFDRSKNRGLRGRCPLDQHLGLFGSFTPGFAKIASRAAAQSSYGEASIDLKELAGLEAGSRQLQRLCQNVGASLREKLKRLPAPPAAPVPVMYVEADGTGVPMNRQALQGVKGRGADGQAKTREVKTGCVFTQTGLNKEGAPERDEASTTWIAGIETASDFGPRLRDEARRRGIAKAARVVFLGDGAAWIWELARNYFPEATCILDFWHASEYLIGMAKLIHPGAPATATELFTRWRGEMAQSKIADILIEAKSHLGREGIDIISLQEKINYLENQQPRMDYAKYRAAGLFIGSGIVEAGCKKVIGARFKCSGMFWSEPGAKNLLHIRTAILSQSRFDDFWTARSAA